MKTKLAAIAANPYLYVVGCAVGGAASIVAGIAVIAGTGWALISAGTFLLGISCFITKGLTPNG